MNQQRLLQLNFQVQRLPTNGKVFEAKTKEIWKSLKEILESDKCIRLNYKMIKA